jgi:hypothetical protein
VTALKVFVDESGVMPARDTDPPFVVVAITLLGTFQATDIVAEDVDNVVSHIKSADAIVCATLVSPFPGFTDQLAAKITMMNGLGRRRLALDGANARYFSKRGLNPRNTVWMNAVSGAVGYGVARILAESEVKKVDVYVDRKTLKPTDAALMERSIERIPRLVASLAVPAMQAGFRRQGLMVSQGGRSTVARLRWSNSRASHTEKPGLLLADALAYQIREHALTSKLEDLANRLGFLAADGFVRDVTNMLIQPVSPIAVEKLSLATARHLRGAE